MNVLSLIYIMPLWEITEPIPQLTCVGHIVQAPIILYTNQHSRWCGQYHLSCLHFSKAFSWYSILSPWSPGWQWSVLAISYHGTQALLKVILGLSVPSNTCDWLSSPQIPNMLLFYFSHLVSTCSRNLLPWCQCLFSLHSYNMWLAIGCFYVII